MSPPHILVLGGAGYIGSHICQALARSGGVPVTYDNLANGHQQAVQWGPLEIGDLLDAERLSSVMDSYRPATIVHAAGLIDVSHSVRDPAAYYRENVSASLLLLEVMRSRGVKQLVFSSSAAVYDGDQDADLSETARIRPASPYGRTKLAVENMLNDWGSAYGMSWLALRYFNAAGADPEGRIGEAHRPETHLIPRILMALTGELEAVSIFGSDYAAPDGTAVRNFVHVCDLADAHVAAVRHVSSTSAGEAVNIGAGKGCSVLEVLAAVEKVTGRRPLIRFEQRRPGDPPKLVADTSLAREMLEFSPRFDKLSDLVATAWAWHTGRRLTWF